MGAFVFVSATGGYKIPQEGLFVTKDESSGCLSEHLLNLKWRLTFPFQHIIHIDNFI